MHNNGSKDPCLIINNREHNTRIGIHVLSNITIRAYHEPCKTNQTKDAIITRSPDI